MGAATLRALHQIVDYPCVFDDPLAIRMIGVDGARQLQPFSDMQGRSLRAFVAMRSRYAEDRLTEAVDRGIRQYVVLGAGLDSFAYRNSHGDRLRVFEVDHPATQRWKRSRLVEAGIPVPSTLTFVPVDFESQSLPAQLRHHGFRFDQPAYFSMLGVVVYLTKEALMDTLRVIAACTPGTGITFSFSLPETHLSDAAALSRQRSMARMDALGEPWRTFLEPDSVVEMLRSSGYTRVDLLAPEAGNQRYFHNRIDGLTVSGSGYMATAQL